MNRQRGFSLIELLIVLAIFLIITAIAIPRFLRARIAANEASAASSLKLIGIANAAYSSLYNVGYAGTLAALGPPGGGGCLAGTSACADLLDSLVSGVVPATPTPVKSGYLFTYYAANAVPTPATTNTSYAVVATPTAPNSSGLSTFCFDNRIAIFKDTSGTTQAADPSGCEATWPVGGSINPL